MVITEEQKKKLRAIKGFKELEAEYARQMKAKGRGGNVRTLKGSGFWEDFIKNAGNVNDFLRKTKVISKTGALATAILPFTPLAEFVPVSAAGTALAGSLGYGYKNTGYRKGRKPKTLVSMPTVPTKPVLGAGMKQKGKGKTTTFNSVSSTGDKVKF